MVRPPPPPSIKNLVCFWPTDIEEKLFALGIRAPRVSRTFPRTATPEIGYRRREMPKPEDARARETAILAYGNTPGQIKLHSCRLSVDLPPPPSPFTPFAPCYEPIQQMDRGIDRSGWLEPYLNHCERGQREGEG